MFSRLFRSRWAALLWAGGIVWTAYDVAAAAPAGAPGNTAVDATGAPICGNDLAVLAKASPE